MPVDMFGIYLHKFHFFLSKVTLGSIIGIKYINQLIYLTTLNVAFVMETVSLKLCSIFVFPYEKFVASCNVFTLCHRIQHSFTSTIKNLHIKWINSTIF